MSASWNTPTIKERSPCAFPPLPPVINRAQDNYPFLLRHFTQLCKSWFQSYRQFRLNSRCIFFELFSLSLSLFSRFSDGGFLYERERIRRSWEEKEYIACKFLQQFHHREISLSFTNDICKHRSFSNESVFRRISIVSGSEDCINISILLFK